MLADIVFYMFLVVVNGTSDGPQGVVSSTMEECQSDYETAKKSPEVLAISECQEVTLKKR